MKLVLVGVEDQLRRFGAVHLLHRDDGFGFGLDAVQNWEQGRRRPEGPARALLKVIEHDPDMVRRALAA